MKEINKELFANISLLYVEDETSIRDEMKSLFEKYINKLYVAKDGEEGLELFKKHKPDIIVTDIQMPKLNGLDMLKQINISNIPIIITTAFSDIEYLSEAVKLGVTSFAIKPINLEKLLFDIQENILNRRIQDTDFDKEDLMKIVDENVSLSISNTQDIITDVSRAFCELTGYSKEEVIGNSYKMIDGENVSDEFYETMWDTISSGKIYQGEVENKNKDGKHFWSTIKITPIFDKEGNIVKYITIRHDITYKKKLKRLSIEDDLTELYNRRYFNEILNKTIAKVKKDKLSLGLVTLDIDYFKKYNDTYGHPQGDKVLLQIANVLKNATFGDSDYAFRIGGEEFAIITLDSNIDKFVTWVESIVKRVEALEIEHSQSGCSKYVTISAGLIIQSYSNLSTFDELYNRADEALYKAKIEGRNQVYLSKWSKTT